MLPSKRKRKSFKAPFSLSQSNIDPNSQSQNQPEPAPENTSGTSEAVGQEQAKISFVTSVTSNNIARDLASPLILSRTQIVTPQTKKKIKQR